MRRLMKRHGPETARVYDRGRLRPGDAMEGPALVAEYTSATVLPPGARLKVDGLRNLVIDVGVDATEEVKA